MLCCCALFVYDSVVTICAPFECSFLRVVCFSLFFLDSPVHCADHHQLHFLVRVQPVRHHRVSINHDVHALRARDCVVMGGRERERAINRRDAFLEMCSDSCVHKRFKILRARVDLYSSRPRTGTCSAF